MYTYFFSQISDCCFISIFQSKANTRKVADLEKTLKKCSSENSLNSVSTVNMDRTADSPFSTNSGAYSPPKQISGDENSKASQTEETAFVPCEACDVVQKKMRESGDLVIDICQNQGLPSSLRKYRFVSVLTGSEIGLPVIRMLDLLLCSVAGCIGSL